MTHKNKVFVIYNMKVVKTINNAHVIRIIPRFVPTGAVVFTLYNEYLSESEVINNTYSFFDGYLDLNFNYSFNNKGRFSFKLEENAEVLYRGKIYVTDLETQNYKQTESVYEF